jgi:hypothetical protein
VKNSVVLILTLFFLFQSLAQAKGSGLCQVLFADQPTIRAVRVKQEIILARYQVKGLKDMTAQLDADLADPNVSDLLKLLARKLKEAAHTSSHAEYELLVSRYVTYLEIRFFRSSDQPITKTADELWIAMGKSAEIEAELFRVYDEDSFGVIRLFNMPNVGSYEETSELRANGLTPYGAIKKIELVDGIPGDLSYFKRHDLGHYSQWTSNLRNTHHQDQTDIPHLILETSHYYDLIISRLAKIHDLNPRTREILFFLYFYVSHEKNIDIINSQRWLYHLARTTLHREHDVEVKLMNELQQKPTRELFTKAMMPVILDEAQLTNWSSDPITYDEVIRVIEIIKSIQ